MSELHPQLIHSLEIFYSYAPKDKELRDKLEQHLSGMQRKGRIIGWYDGLIQAGKNQEREIAAHLNSANIILLLISPDFMASDYHQNIEVKRAMERHEFGDARVIPILLRTVDWQDTPFFKLYSLPTNGQSVVQWTDLDEAFKDIAEGIRRVVDDLSRLPPLANLELINAVQELTHDVSNEQRAAIGNILNVLKQLSRYQKMVNELKIVHNMLHNL